MSAARFCVSVVALTVAVASPGCDAAEETPVQAGGEAAAAAPVIDGVLDDPAWAGALHVDGFSGPGATSLPAAATEAWITFDETTLYVGVKCPVADVSKIKADVLRENDAVWRDDAVEVFVRASGDVLDWDQFIVNSIGTRGWYRVRGRPTGQAWRPDFTAKAVVGEDAWTAELAIPFTDLGLGASGFDGVLEMKIARGDGGAGLMAWPSAVAAGPMDDYAMVQAGPGKGAVRAGKKDRQKPVGPAIPLKANAPRPTVVTKLLVADCRAVRGFLGAPVDGSTRSWGWNGRYYEYNRRRNNAGVYYSYRNNDGLHIKLADRKGVQAVQVRGGVRAKLYRDVPSWTGPKGGVLLAELPGGTLNATRVWLAKPVATDSLSFFDVTDGTISDVSFFHVARVPAGLPKPERRPPGGTKLEKRPGGTRCTVRLPLAAETPLAAVGLDFNIAGKDTPIDLRVLLADPVDRRRELYVADFEIDAPGRVRVVLDFPDQIVPAGGEIRIALETGGGVRIGDLGLDLYKLTRGWAAVSGFGKEATCYQRSTWDRLRRRSSILRDSVGRYRRPGRAGGASLPVFSCWGRFGRFWGLGFAGRLHAPRADDLGQKPEDGQVAHRRTRHPRPDGPGRAGGDAAEAVTARSPGHRKRSAVQGDYPIDRIGILEYSMSCLR